MKKTISVKIDGMHCEGCVRRVTQALNATSGVQVDSVEVGSASVTIDPRQVSPGQIKTALMNIGFTARVDGAPDGD
jgi:copper chaperone